ncbi:translocation/assembly module TamB domain-containing protein [Nodosilinea sp. LEGE 07088]|uniref:translocation/assembly module TamB domain-containing protein n=1 Tax=Nodosilinea sp. LEGE 07088 TaxID=2777968 RepID=UPI001882DCF7|nr:translocation/assembly module TamB domain-containing protein [Nodosilinea sp. LEGE 07088]MBE9140246.1 translocation/assembly module TamB domain-containing protein [Nodosilinea sp. LEGE 07088]
MANRPEPDSTPKSSPRPRRRWLRAIAIAGGGLAVAGLGLSWWGYSFVRRELPEFLQRNLSDAFGRPIKVGEFERFNPTGVRLGPSIVPPTEEDFSWLRAQALEVNFNPIELLLTRTLRPSVVFVKPQVSLKQGFDGEWRIQPLQSVGRDGVFKTELRSVQIRHAELAIGPLSRTSIVEVPEGVSSATLVLVENVNLRLRFSGPDNQTVSTVLGGRINNGSFQIRGEGQIDTRQANLAVRAQQIPINAVNPLVGGNLFVRDGLLSSNLELKIRPQAPDPVTVKGIARLRNGDIVLGRLPSPVQDINGTAVLNGMGGSLENSSLKFGPILVKAAGGVDLKTGHDLDITIPDVTIAQVAEALALALPVEAAGRFQVKTRVTGELLDPQVAGDLTNLGTVQVDRLGISAIAAQFGANLDGAILTQARLRPVTGGTVTAQGRATLGEDLRSSDMLLTAQTDLPIDGIAALYGLPVPKTWRLGPLRADARWLGTPANLQGEATWQLPQSTFPGRGRVSYADRLLRAEDTVFRVGEGTLQAQATADLNRRDWQAEVVGNTLGLSLVSPLLRGTLDTALQASGSLTALNPAAIKIQGQAQFSQAFPLAGPLPGASQVSLNLAAIDEVLPGALSTRFAWTGQRLEILEATSPNLFAQGGVDVQFEPGQFPQISLVDLTARLSAIDLAAAYGVVNGPIWLQPRGRFDFAGTLRGPLGDPRLAGTVGLQQVGLNDFTLLESVAGPVQASLATGARLNLRGHNEELSASLAPDLRPNAFRWASGEFVAQGQRRGNSLDAEIRNFDLAALGLHPVPRPDLGILAGLINATATLDLTDLTNPAAIAQFVLDRPALGTIGGDRLTGNLLYRDGLARLTDGSLQLSPNSEFQIVGSGRLFPEWQGQAQITTAGADFQDLLAALSLYSYADFGRLLNPLGLGTAIDLAVTPVGDPTAPLADQAEQAQLLQEALANRDRDRATALLPALDQLEGGVAGHLEVSASQAAGLMADFEFAGQDWAWGRYDFGNRFVARGQLRDRVLSLDPVAFEAGATRLSLLGSLSPQDSDLVVRAEKLPLTAAATLLESPLAVAGLLTLDARLTGPYTNPNLVGNLAVAEARVNRQPLTEISSRFQYQDAIFNVNGRVVGADPEPLIFAGTVPYALPFATVQPATDQMALRATLQDDALSLVNLLTPVLAWGGGQAKVDLQLSGTPRRPLLSGLVAFDDASFVSPWLGTSLDRLTGAIQLQGTQIYVNSLTGNLFGGSFALTGQVPLLLADAAPSDAGLNLALREIDFNYANNEVRSRVNGDLALTQALLAPAIGGQVRLQDTQVVVGRELISQAQLVVSDRARLERLRAALAQGTHVLPVQLDNLQIALDQTQIRAVPVMSMGLAGGLTLNGSLSALSADGAIALTNGWINTITAEFFLEPGRDNRVLFRPENGLDPDLDVVLAARVPLQRQYNINRLNSTTGAAEEPTYNQLASATVLDELQIEARLQGQVSDLVNNFTLVSSPPYVQDQLLSMVTGGYLAGLGGTEPGLALGSNLLAAFTADSQDAIARAFGLQRLRLGGATVLPTDNKDTLGLGLGVTAGITPNLSASLVQVLNQNQPLVLNARYRINDNWGIGGSINTDNAGRAYGEYRINF